MREGDRNNARRGRSRGEDVGWTFMVEDERS